MSVCVKAVALCRDGDRVFVERGRDSFSGKRFYRAIGGTVEFGERAADAVRREWQEEFSLRLDDVRLSGVLENLFTYEGRLGHEIVFVFEARLAGAPADASVERFAIDTDDGRHEGVWIAIADLVAGTSGIPLYPEGVLKLLSR